MKEKPNLFDKWNRAHRGAFLKGYKAFESGVPASESPYQDIRQDSGKLTWSRSFHAAWIDGWEWAQKESKSKTVVKAFGRLA